MAERSTVDLPAAAVFVEDRLKTLDSCMGGDYAEVGFPPSHLPRY